MSFIKEVGGAVGDIFGALIGAEASRDASNQQADAANEDRALQREIWQQGRTDRAPWMAAGETALNKLMGVIQQGAPKYNYADIQNDPQYKQILEQGMQGVNRLAGVKGYGTGAESAAARVAGNTAGAFTNDIWNRQRQNWQDTINPLMSVAGFGQWTNQQNMAAGANAGEQMQNALFGGANARAENALRQGNIWGDLATNLGSRWGKWPDEPLLPGGVGAQPY